MRLSDAAVTEVANDTIIEESSKQGSSESLSADSEFESSDSSISSTDEKIMRITRMTGKQQK